MKTNSGLREEKLKKDVIDQLYWDSSVDASRIKVVVSDGTVTLTGNVPTYGNRIAADKDASSVRGIRGVDNRLVVQLNPSHAAPTDSEIQSSAQSLLTWGLDDLSPDIHVAVDGGVVTLEGTVDQFWKRWEAEHLIPNLRGVTEVRNHLVVVPIENVVDEEIAGHIEAALDRDAYVFTGDVTVEVKDGKVSLSGQVESSYAARRAFDIAAVAPGVKQVDHELMIG